MQTTLFVHPPV